MDVYGQRREPQNASIEHPPPNLRVDGRRHWRLRVPRKLPKKPGITKTCFGRERSKIARHLLETTDRIFDFLMSPARFVAYFRTYIFPRIANFAMHRESVNHLFFYVLLRPDNYIACISTDISSEDLRDYLRNVIGHPQSGFEYRRLPSTNC